MSAQRILMLYRLTFVMLIILACAQTIVRGSAHQHHAVVLAVVEIAGAAALAWRRSQLLGASLLFLVFATAQVLSAAIGEWSTRFLLYAASTLVIVLLDARLSAPNALQGPPRGDAVL
jgi:hypothetical protein